MPGFLAKAVPWLAVAALLYGAYRLWMWAATGGPSQMARARLIFFSVVLGAVSIVILSKIF